MPQDTDDDSDIFLQLAQGIWSHGNFNVPIKTEFGLHKKRKLSAFDDNYFVDEVDNPEIKPFTPCPNLAPVSTSVRQREHCSYSSCVTRWLSAPSRP